MSPKQLEEAAINAGKTWNAAIGEERFIYSPNSGVKINMIYDGRQAEADKIKKELKELDIQYGSLTELNDKLTKLINDYKSDLNNYNSKVAYWNARGGAPFYEYSRLQRWSSNLENQRTYINQLLKVLSIKEDDYNFNVTSVNAEINNKGLEEFGHFDPQKNLIELFRYEDFPTLTLLITHELGHIKAAGHLDDKASVMNPVLSQVQLANLKPTQADVDLVRSCVINNIK